MLKAWANTLNGRTATTRILTDQEHKQARQDKLLVLFELYDDLVVINGNATTNVHRNGTVYLDPNFEPIDQCECKCQHFQDKIKTAHKIQVWHNPRIFVTDLPHEEFELNSLLGKRKGIVVARENKT